MPGDALSRLETMGTEFRSGTFQDAEVLVGIETVLTRYCLPPVKEAASSPLTLRGVLNGGVRHEQ